MNSEFSCKDILGEISSFTEIKSNGSSLNIIASTFEGSLFSFNFDTEFKHIKAHTLKNIPNELITSVKGIKNPQILIGTKHIAGKNSIYLYDLVKEEAIIEYPVSSTPFQISEASESYFLTVNMDNKVEFFDKSDASPIKKIDLISNFHSLSESENLLCITTSSSSMTQSASLIDKKLMARVDNMALNYRNYTDSKLISSDITKNQKETKLCFGTLDGRVLEFQKTSEKLNLRNVYKAHIYPKLKNSCFPSNVVRYHPTFEGLIVSGGEDGRLSYIDTFTHKLYKTSVYTCQPITNFDFTSDGEHMIVVYGSENSKDQPRRLSRLFFIPLDETYFPQ